MVRVNEKDIYYYELNTFVKGIQKVEEQLYKLRFVFPNSSYKCYIYDDKYKITVKLNESNQESA